MKIEHLFTALELLPIESVAVVIGAVILAMIVVIVLASLKALFQAKSLSQDILKILGINFTIKGSGFLALFIALFILIVASYAVLRVIPSAP